VSFRRACVIGHPVAHSRSPLIHRHWLAEHKIDGDYVREDVPPEKIGSFLASFATSGYVGANVTVPHKEAAFRAADRTEPVAAALKAVNTLWLEQGRLAGTNTDVYGFLAHFDEMLPGWDKRTGIAVVLGAGGAARAVVYGLIDRGIGRVLVVNRTRPRAETLAAEFGKRIAPADFADLPQHLKGTDLLVNATSLGMTGQPPLDIDLACLKTGAAVYDIIYVPLETPLLASARARGHPVVDGLGMLLHQAVPGFERWFGIRPKVTPALRSRVAADLGAKEHAR
jgi:shikimate dehydrogenase